MLIIGVDPGYDRCGVAVIDRSQGIGNEKLLFSTCIQTDKKQDFVDRLKAVLEEVNETLKKYKPDVLAIESVFFNTNQKTATKVAETKGAIMAAAIQNSTKILELTPLQIKLAITNSGRADKKAIYQMLQKLIQIEKQIKLDDEYDAIACALTASALI